MEEEFKKANESVMFSYRRHSESKQTYTLLKSTSDAGYQPVGDYTVLDKKEDCGLSEKKVMNLVALLNGKDATNDVSEDIEGTKLFYYESPSAQTDKTKIVFYKQDGSGVSKENALFLINKEVWGHA
tara:strand:+ start:149 stop:529 length:381 start_codon:yes stop_codon:yes gene_type:complete